MKKIIISTINLYQKTISPDHGPLRKSTGHCRFYPSCSEYTKQAVIMHGSARGAVKGVYRVLRCNPFSAGGFDESYRNKQIIKLPKAKATHV